jgi:hypothetical protein
MKRLFLASAIAASLVAALAGCGSGADDGPSAPKHLINFDAGEGSGAMSAMSVEEGASVALAACAFTPPSGKTFGGWMTGASEISAAYEDGASYAMGSSDVTLYAYWGTPSLGLSGVWSYNKDLTFEDTPFCEYLFFATGGLPIGDYHELTLTITNSGDGALHFTGSPRASIGSDNHSNYTVRTQPSAAILPKKTTVVTIRCTADSNDAFARLATLSLPNDDPTHGSLAFSLFGYSC